MSKENIRLSEEIQKLEAELQEAMKSSQVTPSLILYITFLPTPFSGKIISLYKITFKILWSSTTPLLVIIPK